MTRPKKLLLVCSSFLMASSHVWAVGAKTYASESKRLDFAYITDAKPVSYRESGLSGYCKELSDFLGDSSRTLHWDVQSTEISYESRFTGLEGVKDAKVRQNGPGVECGPNSITRERITQLSHLVKNNPGKIKNAEFTRPFFVTTTKLLIRKDLVSTLFSSKPPTMPPKEDYEFRVGSLAGKSDTSNNDWSTTNFDAIETILPRAKPVPLVSRDDAVKKLVSNDVKERIDAYAGDEVLLASTLETNRAKLRDFTIFPRHNGFTREEYGIIVYNDIDLLNLLNKEWIGSPQELKARSILERSVWQGSFISRLVNSPYFYYSLSGLLLLAGVLLLTHHYFIFSILRMLPSEFSGRVMWVSRDLAIRRKRSGLFGRFLRKFIDLDLLFIIAQKTSRKSRVSFAGDVEDLSLLEDLRSLLSQCPTRDDPDERTLAQMRTMLRRIESKYKDKDSFRARTIKFYLGATGSQVTEWLNIFLLELARKLEP